MCVATRAHLLLVRAGLAVLREELQNLVHPFLLRLPQGGGGGAAMVATGPAAVPAGSGVRVRCGVRDDARGGARSGCLARGRSSRGATTCG